MDLRKVTGDEGVLGNDLEFAAARTSLTDQTWAAFEQQFQDFSSPTVVRATRIADINSWPKVWDSLKGYMFNACYQLNQF